MTTVINTNIAALDAQRQLGATSGQLATALQRLSSGLRVNSARDDAAGLAIADRMTTQVRGLNQGIRNAADGISLAQTAEGGLDSIANNLQRIRELAVQSANFTNTATDRAALQLEVDQLKEEITRVANQTSFNGVKLLNGSFTTATFQAGANVGETIDVSGLTDSRTTALGVYHGVDASSAAIGSLSSKTISINGAGAMAVTGNTAAEVAASVNSIGILNLYASVDGTGVRISSSRAGDITLTNWGASAGTQTLAVGSVTTNTINTVDLSTVTGANKALLSVDAALSTVNSSRARLGAAMNRFEAAIGSQRIAAEAHTASRSRIQDADFAQETAALTRAQILQQSGMAILSQANVLPQNVLSLLR